MKPIKKLNNRKGNYIEMEGVKFAHQCSGLCAYCNESCSAPGSCDHGFWYNAILNIADSSFMAGADAAANN